MSILPRILVGLLTVLLLSGAQAAHLVNLSARCHIYPDNQKMAIAGFVVEGSSSKQVLIRALSVPSLSPDFDPQVELVQLVNGQWQTVKSNDNWQDGDDAAAIRNLAPNLIPANPVDAALLVDLPPGVYTAMVSGPSAGVGVVGVDDLDAGAGSQLVNISARCAVESGANNAIAGFIIQGEGTMPVLLRGLRVAQFDAAGVFDPALEAVQLVNGAWQAVDSNDNWPTHSKECEINSLPTNYVPAGTQDAAILQDLSAGVYTALLKPVGEAGVGVVGVDKLSEIPGRFSLPPVLTAITEATGGEIYQSESLTLGCVSSATATLSGDAGATLIHNGVAGGTSATVNSGDTLAIQATAADTGSKTLNLSLNGQSTDWSLTTAEVQTQNHCPFSFTDLTSVTANADLESNSVSFCGLTDPATVTLSGGLASLVHNGIDTGATSVTVNNGDTLRISTTAPAAGSSKTLTLNVNGESAEWHISAATPQAPTGESGAMSGYTPVNCEVNESGAAVCSIPVTAPPGTAGMAPQLSLNYSSQGGNGPLGMGWALGGLSAITRCPATQAQDGFIDGVDFDAKDRFCLDGERLMAVDGAYGADGTVYYTEQNSFQKVVSYGSAGSGPASFKVWSKAGLVMEYGATPDSRIEAQGRADVLVWAVNKISDTLGNYLAVAYQENNANGEYYPLRIDYTGNDSAGLNPYAAVRFFYAERPDVMPAYVSGSVVKATQRLVRIETWDGANKFREYRLSYEQSGTRQWSKLVSVQECGTDGSCFRPSEFDWGTAAVAQNLDESFTIDASWGNGDFTWVGDFNGDGLTDIASASGENVYMKLSTGIGFDSETWTVSNEWGAESRTWIADFNGDGLTDIASASGTDIYMKLSTGSGFSSETWTTPNWIAGATWLGDFNGDGLPDIASANVIKGSIVSMRLSTGSGFMLETWAVPVEWGSRTWAADFNGDGLTDIASADNDTVYMKLSTGSGFTTESWMVSNQWGAAHLNWVADFNADGLYDIVSATGANVVIKFSTGTGFRSETWSAANVWGSSEHNWLGDFNADGFVDIASRIDNVIYVKLAGVSEFVQTHTFLSDVWDSSETPWIGDFNGNGIQEVLSKNSNKIQVKELDALNLGADIPKITYQYVPLYGISINAESLPANCSLKYKIRTIEAHADHYEILWSDWILSGNPFYFSRNYGYQLTGIQIALTNCDGWNLSYNAKNSIGDLGWVTNDMPLQTVMPANCFKDSYRFGYAHYCRLTTINTGFWRDYYLLNGLEIKLTPDSNATLSSALTINPTGKLIHAINNGNNTRVELTYNSITTPSVYTKGTDAVYPQTDFIAPLYVVSKITADDGIGGQRSIRYQYEDAKLDLQGRGFRGFGKTVQTDETTGIQQITLYERDYRYLSTKVKRSETRLADGTLIAATDNTPELKAYGNGVHFSRIKHSVSRQYELDGSLVSTVVTANQYDDYGNPTRLDIKHYAGDISATPGLREVTVNTYDNHLANWHLGRLRRSEVTKTVPSQVAQTRVSEFGYDSASGLLTLERIEPGHALCVEKAYSHDDFGNIETSTVRGCASTSPAIAARTHTTRYDAQGRYVTQSINALNHSETKQYTLGNLTRLTGPNGLTTTWAYDGFGRVILENRADGTQTRTDYRLCAGAVHCPAGAHYFVRTHSAGSAPVYVYYDKLDREVRKATQGFDGLAIYTDIVYNARGETAQVSDPYFATATPLWTVNQYDAIGRLKQQTAPDGSVIRTEYAGLETTVYNALNQVNTRRNDVRGNLKESTDNAGNTVRYAYDAFGNLVTLTDSAGNRTEMDYDIRGNKTRMYDPDSGITQYAYNALGELVTQTDARYQTVTTRYDKLGRMVWREEPEGVSTWTYDTATHGIGKLTEVNGAGGYRETYRYDSFGRAAETLTRIDGQVFAITTHYDQYGRAAGLTYPTGFAVRQVYNAHGYLNAVHRADNDQLLWQADKINARGQLEQQRAGNGLVTQKAYEATTGRVRTLQTGHAGNTASVQNLGFSFDAVGNLQQRTQGSLAETFTYDNLNRLQTSRVDGQATVAIGYDALGNIVSKTGVGSYTYGSREAGCDVRPGPHAVARAGNLIYCYDTTGNRISASNGQQIAYTSFNKPQRITQGGTVLEFRYNPSHSRYSQTIDKNGTLTNVLYLGQLYEQETAAGVTKGKHTVFAGSNSVAVYTLDSTGRDHTRYLHKDHLGSLTAVSDENGALVEDLSFDAWGLRRAADTWGALSEAEIRALVENLDLDIRRGFTGHEHLDEVMLIHMNGRIYDPVIGRFLSADPFVQEPGNLQSLNRYAYVVNNPLSLVDPSGYIFGIGSKIKELYKDAEDWVSDHKQELIGIASIGFGLLTGGLGAIIGQTFSMSAFGTAVLSGAGFGFGASFSGTLLFGGSMGDALKSGLRGALIGGITAGLTYGVGSFFEPDALGTQIFGAASRAAKVVAHGVVGGVSSIAKNGRFEHGFLSGVFTAGFSPMIDGIQNMAGRVAASAVIGGTAAELGGGKFANGAVAGAFIRLYNEEAHRQSKRSISYYRDKINSHPGTVRAMNDYMLIEEIDKVNFTNPYRIASFMNSTSCLRYGCDESLLAGLMDLSLEYNVKAFTVTVDSLGAASMIVPVPSTWQNTLANFGIGSTKDIVCWANGEC